MPRLSKQPLKVLCVQSSHLVLLPKIQVKKIGQRITDVSLMYFMLCNSTWNISNFVMREACHNFLNSVVFVLV